jgi:DNA-binding transcriptional LysR family regulator
MLPPRFSLQRLQYLVTIADERSFTRAAERLGVSQPALSRQVSILEGELGVALLERTSAGIVPSPIGREVVVEARKALAAAQRVSQVAHDSMHLEMGQLEIATFPTLATGLLLPAIRTWNDRYPNVTIRLCEYRSRNALQEAMRLGLGDLAIGVRPDDWAGPSKLLGLKHFVAVLPSKSDLLLEQGPIDLSRLAAERWVLYDRTYGLADVTDVVFSIAGFRPNPAIETSQAEAAAKLAAAGLGPALVPPSNIPSELIANSRPFEPVLAYEIYAYSRQRWSASARAFLDIVAEEKWPAQVSPQVFHLPPY